MKKAVLLFLVLAIVSCQPNSHSSSSKSKYLRWVGDIEANPQLDDPSFVVCDEANTKQYFNFIETYEFAYKGERTALRQVFKENYQPISKATETGLIRIRFIVNCKGQSGRFRLISANHNLEEKIFDKKITQQLLEITKSLDGWPILPSAESPSDYYQYLIFKMEEGHIKEILP